MYVLPGALPEEFFLEASPECLEALAVLVDPGIARFINKYMKNANAREDVKAIIHKYFDTAIKHATFSQELYDNGTADILRNLNFDVIASMTDTAAMQKLYNTIDTVLSNKEFIHSTIMPNTKTDYENFLCLCPAAYKTSVASNRDYFYYPRAKEANTGLGVVIRHETDLQIAAKGLISRLEASKHGTGWQEGLRYI